MNWLNLHVSVLDSPEFIGASPVERSTWICLLRYCVGQENGGIIKDCRQWKDRQWQQLIRVTLREVQASCSLWAWSESSLTVMYYPLDKENELKTKRDAAASNGKKGGRPPKRNQPETNVGFQNEPTTGNSGKAEIRNGGMEEIGNCGSEEAHAQKPSRFDDSPSPTQTAILAERIVSIYPRTGGNAFLAQQALMASIESGEDGKWIETCVGIHAERYGKLPPSERQFCPGKERYFADERWKDNPDEAPWMHHPKTNGEPRPIRAQSPSDPCTVKPNVLTFEPDPTIKGPDDFML